MRIRLSASIAVLISAAVLFLAKFVELHIALVPYPQSEYLDLSTSTENEAVTEETELSTAEIRELAEKHEWMSLRNTEKLLTLEGGRENLQVDCCPSVTVMTTPDAAIDVGGNGVMLYRNGDIRQHFYETSCRDGVENMPCRFMHKTFHNRSRCVQKWSFSYALVAINRTIDDESAKPLVASDQYVLDHVQIRSGCSCEIAPKKPKPPPMPEFREYIPQKMKKNVKFKQKRIKNASDGL